MPAYAIRTAPDDNDTVLITCPALPEVTTFAEAAAEAPRIAARAIDEALCARLAVMGPIPGDDGGEGLVRPSLQTDIKAELARLLARRGQTRADLVRALGWQRPQVDRLFQPGHATRLDQFDAAFAALGARPALLLADA